MWIWRHPRHGHIEVRDLSKRFGVILAVDGLSFDVAPRPSTERPTGGSSIPSRQVGVVLEDTAFHPEDATDRGVKGFAATAATLRRRVLV